MKPEPITIAGGGLSGLSAAITLARAGREVVVYEKGTACGANRHGDLEGLETWIFPEDPIAYLQDHGLPTTFDHQPVRAFHYVDDRGKVHGTAAGRVYFYLVRRGARPGCLDRAFQQAAEAVGVEVRCRAAREPYQVHIFAGGPRRASAYIQGMTFHTSAPDGIYLLLGRRFAPQGYAYGLIWNGRGTIAAAHRADRSGARQEFDSVVECFRVVLGLEMTGAARFGSYGCYAPRPTLVSAGALLVGEAAGFQDGLFGFGMNYAVRSGVLAARALLEEARYSRLCRVELTGRLASSWVNRRLYEQFGDKGRSLLAGRLVQSGTAWEALHRVSQPTLKKRLLAGWSHLLGAR